MREGTRQGAECQAEGQGEAEGIVKRKPLYERAEKAGRELGRGMYAMVKRFAEKQITWSAAEDDLQYSLRCAWYRGYASGRRDEKRRANA